jgi:CHAD domain-containing protein
MPEQNTKEERQAMPVFGMPRLPALLDSAPSQDWQFGPWCQYILLSYMRDLLAQRELVWRNEQREGVHQIRVASRRLRTALQTFGSMWDPVLIRRHSRYLAKFADAFGVARDLDVMIDYLEGQLHGAHRERRSALDWMLARKRQLRYAQQPRLEEVLLRFENDNYAEEFVELFSNIPTALSQLETAHEG